MSAPKGAGPSTLPLGRPGRCLLRHPHPAPGQGEEGRGTAGLLFQATLAFPRPVQTGSTLWAPGPVLGVAGESPGCGGEGLAITLGSQSGDRGEAGPVPCRGPEVHRSMLTELLNTCLRSAVPTGALDLPAPWSWGLTPGVGRHRSAALDRREQKRGHSYN